MKTIPYAIHHYPRPRRNRRRSWGLMPRLRPSLGLAIFLGWAAAFGLAYALTWIATELHALIY